jgi:hypothetical protein
MLRELEPMVMRRHFQKREKMSLFAARLTALVTHKAAPCLI